MGGHSKKKGKGGGHHGGRQARKHLRRDPGVPDLKDAARRLTQTLQRRNHSVLSIPAMPSAAPRHPQTTPADTPDHLYANEEVDERGGSAARRREMTALALRTAERTHDYAAPHRLYDEDGNGGEAGDDDDDDEAGDRRGADQTLRRFYKTFQRVVESCDVLLQVVDARDPLGCRLTRLERNIRSSYGEDRKRIVIVLNKVDLLPSREVQDAWIQYFEQQEHLLCVPFAATGKGAAAQASSFYVANLFRRLRGLAREGSASGERKAIVVGVIGYPNVGKSSIINALKRKPVVGVGNTPGFTTGNTEVGLRSDIRVMDCPGVVTPGEDSGDVVLRNAIKVSSLSNPFTAVQRLLQRCTATQTGAEDATTQHRLRAAGLHPLALFYNIGSFDTNDVYDFVRQVGLRRGRLLKGGQVDEEATARMILGDWNDGRIPYYTLPPTMAAFEHGGFQASDVAALSAETAAPMSGNDGASPRLVPSLSHGLTIDGLPTFHLSLAGLP